MTTQVSNPGRDCPLCPRLVEFRHENRHRHVEWFNAPVPGFGCSRARLLIVGLAPGLKGANRTGRPFTGDYAGDLLYHTLKKFHFAAGAYQSNGQDGLVLKDCWITNAVRCVPPHNKPTPTEVSTCRAFLVQQIQELSRLRVILALGSVAHSTVLKIFKIKVSAARFAHGAQHLLPKGLVLVDSYHCSRYNTQTKRLSPFMFEEVFASIRTMLQ